MTRKNRRSEYEQIWSGEWHDVAQVRQLACCDCGKVHDLDHRLRNGVMQITLVENLRETSILRRYYKHEFKKA